jgi:hypothetical protein
MQLSPGRHEITRVKVQAFARLGLTLPVWGANRCACNSLDFASFGPKPASEHEGPEDWSGIALCKCLAVRMSQGL